MAKRYYALKDRIQFNGRIYGLHDSVMVDDKVEMEADLWQDEESYRNEIEALRVSREDKTLKEKNDLIQSLQEDNKNLRADNARLEKDLNKAQKDLRKFIEEQSNAQ